MNPKRPDCSVEVVEERTILLSWAKAGLADSVDMLVISKSEHKKIEERIDLSILIFWP
jgi:hypothetical protein